MSLQESNSVSVSKDEIDRQKMYKNAGKHEDMRRRRTECSVEIRKQKRGDAMMKRRNLETDGCETGDESQTEGAEPKVNWSLNQVYKCLTNNPTLPQLRDAFESLRRNLSKDKNPPIDEVIRMNLVEAMVRGLSVEDPKVQFESAWGLTNIVSGTTEQTRHAIEKGCIPPLLQLSISTEYKLAEQAAWALANITGDNAEFRDMMLKHNCLHVVEHLTQNLNSLSNEFVRTIAWWYSNLCRHKKSRLSSDVLRRLAPGLCHLIEYNDEAVQQDSCWALSYMTDGPDEYMQIARDAGCIDKVVLFLDMAMKKSKFSSVAPAVRVLGNFTSGADELTQVVVDSGCIQRQLPHLLTSRNTNILKESTWLESTWLVSNIFAGTKEQIQVALDANLLPLVLKVFAVGDARSQEEAHWAIYNLTSGGTPSQTLKLLEGSGLNDINEGLQHTPKVDVLKNMLDALKNVLNHVAYTYNDRLPAVLEAFEASDLTEFIESCQNHDNEDVYKMAYDIVSNFFCDEDDADFFEENKENDAAPQGGFSF
uniref:Importin subunit alpha n=1 Tax=Steinernema glaseri TaxID=37863 RepID=A0A1I7Y3S0_9BILA